MGSTQKVEGPDLRVEGIPLADLRENEPMAGHVDGAPAVVVRTDGDMRAVGAKCTHYGALLSDGFCVAGQIRCPLHHGSFDLASGSAVGAPAMDPIPVYATDVRDGKLFVIGTADVPRRQPNPPTEPSSIVIVGAGAAGAACAESLRRNGYRGPISLIGGEPPLDRPNLSKDYLAGTAPEDWIPLRPSDWYIEKDIELIVDDLVTSLDLDECIVELRSGRVIPYGSLLLATGAEPRRIPLSGADLPHVRYLRSLGDSRGIIDSLDRSTRVAVIGAGFIGLEVAASMRQRDIDVTVIAPEDVPLARIVGETLGGFVEDLHRDHGVDFRLGRGVSEIREESVELDDGETIPADLVVVGIGVVPRTGLAEDAGLAVDRGIIVDDRLRTSAPAIWAAGDVARYPGPGGDPVRVEHWVLAQRQGQAVAANMLGHDRPFTDPPFFWSQHYDVPINVTGHLAGWDEDIVVGDPDDGEALVGYRVDGEVRAVATVHRDVDNLRAERALEVGDHRTLDELLAP